VNLKTDHSSKTEVSVLVRTANR